MKPPQRPPPVKLVVAGLRAAVAYNVGHQTILIEEETPVPSSLDAARHELALANRIVANEGVLDAFGHVSMRHPQRADRYLLSRSRAPELVETDDFIEYDLDSRPLRDPGSGQYSERVIHGEIYKARPDVMSVCHHHAPAFMPLLASGTDYVPVFHLGAIGGMRPPFWDQHDEFGDTNMLVVKPEEGASLARAMGAGFMVLMRRHGVTVAGASLHECVFRTINACRNADFQARGMALGPVTALWPGEIEQASRIVFKTTGLARSWEYWTVRLGKVGGLPAPAPKKGAAKRVAKPRASANRPGASANKPRARVRKRRR